MDEKIGYKGRILVADDESQVREFMSDLLSGEKYQVITASNGVEAMGIIASEDLDLVISDIRMPGLDGVEILKRVRQMKPDVQVILITGYQSLESAIEAAYEGVYDYITKPFTDISRLINSINRAIRERNLLKEKSAILQDLYDTKIQSDFMMKNLANSVKLSDAILKEPLDINDLERLTDDLHDTFQCSAWGVMSPRDIGRPKLDIFMYGDVPSGDIEFIKQKVFAAYSKVFGPVENEPTENDIKVVTHGEISEAESYDFSKEVIAIPLSFCGEDLGIIFIYGSSKESFSEDQSYLFSIMANQIAAVMRASKLLES